MVQHGLRLGQKPGKLRQQAGDAVQGLVGLVHGGVHGRLRRLSCGAGGGHGGVDLGDESAHLVGQALGHVLALFQGVVCAVEQRFGRVQEVRHVPQAAGKAGKVAVHALYEVAEIGNGGGAVPDAACDVLQLLLHLGGGLAELGEIFAGERIGDHADRPLRLLEGEDGQLVAIPGIIVL